MAKPTYQDATLMLQIAQWAATSGVPEAVNWLWSDQFLPNYEEFVKKYPPGSDGFAKATRVCGSFELIGTLYKQGLFSEELLFDWLAVYPLWDRIRGFALGWREQMGVPGIYENFEAMAKAQRGYSNV